MTNSWNSPDWCDLHQRRRIAGEILLRAIRRDPAIFRQIIRLHDERRAWRAFRALMQPWQRADFEALDPAWRRLAGQNVTVPFHRAYIERPRGHSKTSDMALQLAWILLYGRDNLSGLVAAADAEQAGLVREALRRLADGNAALFTELDFFSESVVNRVSRSRLKIISSDVSSSWGRLPDFVICDELCHWTKPELWESLLSSAAKKSDCLLAVLTNAGAGRDWHWRVRESARMSPRWYFSSLDGPQAPWISREVLEEQREMLPPPVFERLWLNRWQHSEGTFVTLAEAEACRDASLTPQTHGEPYRRYVAAVDYAEKRDLTVGVVLHREGDSFVVDRMDAVRPVPAQPTRVEWVDAWIEGIAARFHDVTFVLDPWQLVGTIQRYEGLYDLRRFDFGAGRGNHALALALRRTILHRQVRWFPGCGQLPDQSERDDLETELASLLLRQSTSGRCRIDHSTGGIHHDDRSFALGAALLHALSEGAAAEWMHIEHPGSLPG